MLWFAGGLSIAMFEYSRGFWRKKPSQLFAAMGHVYRAWWHLQAHFGPRSDQEELMNNPKESMVEVGDTRGFTYVLEFGTISSGSNISNY